LVGLVLLLVYVVGGYGLFKCDADVCANLEPQLATLAAIGSVAAFLCVVIVAEGLKALGKETITQLSRRKGPAL
jgi:hypothetical protein